MAAANQSNSDQNQNAGGYVGEVEANFGIDGSSSASATSSATSSLASGDKNVSSGRSSAGTIGSLKSAGLILAALAFYAVYAFSKKRGK